MTHRAYLCLGSNIDPVENLRRAVQLLRQRTEVLSLSSCWETEAVMGNGAAGQAPNFLNLGACIRTTLDPEALKAQILRPLEQELGRVRTADKYAPRTIDLDITLYDRAVLDPELWRRPYLALVFAEMLPDLRNAETGETLSEAARRLKTGRVAVRYPIDLPADGAPGKPG